LILLISQALCIPRLRSFRCLDLGFDEFVNGIIQVLLKESEELLVMRTVPETISVQVHFCSPLLV